jgi:hypothetical protein
MTEDEIKNILEWIALFVFFAILFFRPFGAIFDEPVEDDEVTERETNAIYEDADGTALLDAKVRCLELAQKTSDDPARVIRDAQTYWEWLTLEPEIADEQG